MLASRRSTSSCAGLTSSPSSAPVPRPEAHQRQLGLVDRLADAADQPHDRLGHAVDQLVEARGEPVGQHVVDLPFLPAAASMLWGRPGAIRPLTRLPRPTCPESALSAFFVDDAYQTP